MNFEKLFDMMMKGKLLSGCDKYFKHWVQERRPRNVSTLVELAEFFQSATKNVQVGSCTNSLSGNSLLATRENNSIVQSHTRNIKQLH